MPKKKYSKPVVFKVRLDPSQAILAVCYASATSVKNSSSSGFCKRNCKQSGNSGGSNSAASS